MSIITCIITVIHFYISTVTFYLTSNWSSNNSVYYVSNPFSFLERRYVAVSNCATLSGLDLQYRLVVYGHIGECRSRTAADGILGSSSMVDSNSPRAQIVSAGGGGSSFESTAVSDALCVLDGDLNTTSNWYGFLANVSLARGGGFRFKFKYPSGMQEENVILYSDEDIMKLNHEQSCWQKEGVIRSTEK